MRGRFPVLLSIGLLVACVGRDRADPKPETDDSNRPPSGTVATAKAWGAGRFVDPMTDDTTFLAALVDTGGTTTLSFKCRWRAPRYDLQAWLSATKVLAWDSHSRTSMGESYHTVFLRRGRAPLVANFLLLVPGRRDGQFALADSLASLLLAADTMSLLVQYRTLDSLHVVAFTPPPNTREVLSKVYSLCQRQPPA